MQVAPFRSYLRRFAINPATNKPIIASTVERYIQDIDLIERRLKEKGFSTNIDELPLGILSSLVETRMTDIVGQMDETSIQNYQTSGRHYVSFRKQNNAQAQ